MDFRRHHTVPTTTASDPRAARHQPPRRAQDRPRRLSGAAHAAGPARGRRTPPRPPRRSPTSPTSERGWLERASRNDVNGWIHLRIEGAPFERGFQHGYLIAAEYADAIRVYDGDDLSDDGLRLRLLRRQGRRVSQSEDHARADARRWRASPPDYTAAGVPTTLDDIIGWNAYMEMTGYWWPTVASQYVNDAPDRQPQEPLLAPSSPPARRPPTAASSSATSRSPSSGTASS